MIAPFGCHNARNRGMNNRPTPRRQRGTSKQRTFGSYEHLMILFLSISFLLLFLFLLPIPPLCYWDSYLFSLKNDLSHK